MIVLDDAHIDVAASAAVTGGLYNTGQTCCSVEKLLVHADIAKPFMEAFIEKLKKVRQGPPSDFETDIGPVTYGLQKKTYLSQIQDHIQHHGKTFFGPVDYDGKSNFMKPLIVEAGEGGLFWNEETFGPVMAVKTFHTDEEAIQIANDGHFGLTALVWSGNNNRAQRLARNLRVGTVVINDAPFTNAVAALPWGGVRDSGFGWVHGELGLKELSQAQVITYDISGQQKQFWWFPHGQTQYEFFKYYINFLEGQGFKHRLNSFVQMIKSLMKMGPRL